MRGRASLEGDDRLSQRSSRDSLEETAAVPDAFQIDERDRALGVVGEIVDIVIDPELGRVAARDRLRDAHTGHARVMAERGNQIAALTRNGDSPGRWVRRHHLRAEPGARRDETLPVRTGE